MHPHDVLLLQRVEGKPQSAARLSGGTAPATWCHLSALQESDSSLTHTELLSAESWCLVLLLWLQAVTAGIYFV